MRDTGVGVPRVRAAAPLRTLSSRRRPEESIVRRIGNWPRAGPGARQASRRDHSGGKPDRKRLRICRFVAVRDDTFVGGAHRRWAVATIDLAQGGGLCRGGSALAAAVRAGRADGPADRAGDAPDLRVDGKSDGARVLIADDNADMRNYIRRLLGTRWNVEAVSDGAAAIEAIRARKPDLVLTDVMMPGLSGFGLLRELRGDPDLRDLPVIVLSARAGEEARVEGLDAGADDYLTKPFSSRELVARVNANLEMARIRREAAEALRARTAELEAVLETAPAAVWFTSAAEATRIWGNRQAAELLRLPPDINPLLVAPIGEARRYEIFRDGTRVERSDLPLHRAARGHDVRDEELEIRFDDGASTTILIRAKPLRRPDGAIVGRLRPRPTSRPARKPSKFFRRPMKSSSSGSSQRSRRGGKPKLSSASPRRWKRSADSPAAWRTISTMSCRSSGAICSFWRGTSQEICAASSGCRPRLERSLAAQNWPRSFSPSVADNLLPQKSINLGRLIRGIDDMLRRALGEGIEVETVVAGGLWNTFVDRFRSRTLCSIWPSMRVTRWRAMASSPSKPETPSWTTPMRPARGSDPGPICDGRGDRHR